MGVLFGLYAMGVLSMGVEAMQNTFFQQPGVLPDETSFDSLPTAAPLIPICFVRSVSLVRTPSACVNYSAWKGVGRAEQPFEACADCRAWNGSPF